MTLTSWIVCVKIMTSKEGRMNEERRMRRTKLRASSCVETVVERVELEANTIEEDGWTQAEEHEDIQDDVAIYKLVVAAVGLCSGLEIGG